jgi:flagellar basal body-associated protein FliL
MDLEQIPKEFQPKKQSHNSLWLFVFVVILAVLFGLFWFLGRDDKNDNTPAETQEVSQNYEVPAEQLDFTSDLEASVGSIDIPNYSDEL